MKTVLNSIVGNEQMGFLKGRFVGENIDLISYCDEKSVPGGLLVLDFEKAFDRPGWSFIQHTLTSFNFGPKLKNWINVLYSNVTSCVSNNGYLSAYFKISCGVRQGCPLSPYLFIICTEILCTLIYSDQLITGISISGVPLKISLYADDTFLLQTVLKYCLRCARFNNSSAVILV